MKTKVYKGTEETAILTGIIVHDGVLGRIHQHLGQEQRPFKNKWSNLIYKWCAEYYAKYEKAPKQVIQQKFSEYAISTADAETVDLVETLLSHLNNSYEQTQDINENYLVDLASAYFKRIRLNQVVEVTQAALENNDMEEAEKTFASYQPVDFSTKAWGTLDDPEAIKSTFRKLNDPDRELIKFPGDLGKFLSPHLERTAFIAFAGPDKVGKSYWLQEIFWQGTKQRRKILYYVLGDMPEEDVRKRLYCRMIRRPWTEQTLDIPYKIVPHGKSEPPELFTKSESFKGVTPSLVTKAVKRLRVATATLQLPLKMRFAGGYVVSAGEIERDVKEQIKKGWNPDVIVVDYADELAAEPHSQRMDKRHQTDLSWTILRRIALDNRCLVVTATQTASSAYAKGKWLIGKGDFSEDKRKNAHVTGMIGINQSESERKYGIYHLNWIVLRGQAWGHRHVVWTAGNLSISRPAIVSSF